MLGLRMVGRPGVGCPAEFLLELVVQREGVKLGVAQQHAGHGDAERGRHGGSRPGPGQLRQRAGIRAKSWRLAMRGPRCGDEGALGLSLKRCAQVRRRWLLLRRIHLQIG